MNSTPLLNVQDLCVVFPGNAGPVAVVDHISFTLGSSETLAMVGESGSGKSVTALTVLNLIPKPPAQIRSGKILFRKADDTVVDLVTLDPPSMQGIRGRSVSMIFQEPMTSLNPVFTCGDQVAESLRVHLGMSDADARNQVLELFNEVKLPRPEAMFRSYPHQLSGGQKQRVMIAMAISCNPAILIADEPTTALDVTVQKTILELLQQLQEKRKMSILFITHDLGLVSGFAHRVMVIRSGRIVEQGTVAGVFQHPEHPYTKGLLACRPPLNIRPERLPTVTEYLSGGPAHEHPVVSAIRRQQDHEKLYARTPVLRVEHLSKQFGRLTVLKDATFDVYPGETLGIVGESGSGKTTLARTALELIPPGEGRVLFGGLDITKIPARQMKGLRKDLQIIFQDPYSSLNPRITIGEAIREPMKVHRLHGDEPSRKGKVIELLEKVGLEAGHYTRYPHEFSGGQRQRICIARALALEPKLIICDESVSALDVSIQAQVLNLLNDLKKEFNLTYIFISHDLAVVKYMSDRIIVMKNGQIVEMGEADKVFGDPVSDYTRALLAAVPGI